MKKITKIPNPSKLMKLTLIIPFVILMTSCTDRRSKSEVDLDVMMDASALPVSAVSAEENLAISLPLAKDASQVIDRKLIKNGVISFETNDIEKTKKEIEKLYQEFNGYVASENHFNYGERLTHEQEVRVPSKNFDSFILKLE